MLCLAFAFCLMEIKEGKIISNEFGEQRNNGNHLYNFDSFPTILIKSNLKFCGSSGSAY